MREETTEVITAQGGILDFETVFSGQTGIPHAGIHAMPERILQFGTGNFLRGFADWMVDLINEKGLFQGKVVMLQSVGAGMARRIRAQDGMYTLILRGRRRGGMVEQRRVITSISRCLVPASEWREVVAAAMQSSMRFVVSNTTEAGISYKAEMYDGTTSPDSFPGKVAALLLERFRAFGGDPGKGLVFLPCELIANNGTKLKECVLRLARIWNTEEGFIEWINTSNYFLNTLVDRIVSGYSDEDHLRLQEELGYVDHLVVSGEIFHLWVIEGPKILAEELPFHKAGLNVIWTDDMTPYRTLKVRVLNGAHAASVHTALLAGLDTVGEMAGNSDFGPLLRRAVLDEILPHVPGEAAECRAYAESVLERFSNPAIHHKLIDITLNSVSKWKVRILPSLMDALAHEGRLLPILSFSLAALIRFYYGERVSKSELRGTRDDGTHYPIHDSPEILEFFADEWADYLRNGNVSRLVTAVLSNQRLWGFDLTTIGGFSDSTTTSLKHILQKGTRTAALSIS